MQFPVVSISLVIIIVTVITSFKAFNNQLAKEKLIFWPYEMMRNKQWWRMLSSGFIHNDLIHLIFNMYVLYIFGNTVEDFFGVLFGGFGSILFVLFYLMALVASSLPDLAKHRDNPYYRALGASGAVSAIVFAFILFAPTAPLTLLFLPFMKIPAIVLGILYLLYSAYMAKRNLDNIGHSAHFFGAIFGFFFPICIKPKLFLHFINQILAIY